MTGGRKGGSRPQVTRSRLPLSADEGPAAAAVDALLPRVASGDAKAFAGVYDLVAGPVYGLASRITGDQSQAEQVAAQVLLEVWRSAARFDPAEGSGLAWIMTMARRRAMRRAASHAAAGDGYPAGLRPAGAAEVIEERGARSLLAHRGLASLPGPQREAVLLACCGYTLRQAADLAGIAPGTVAERIRDGLRGLSGHPREDR